MTLKLTRLSPALGAEVHDVDLSQPISDALLAELHAAWLQHQVLFFRGQTLSPRQQRDFAARFGPLHTHPIYPQHPDAPEIMVLDTEAFDLRDNAIWHTDVTFNQNPPLGAVLAARKLPEVGGDTLWASGTAAFAALSPALQTLLTGLSATHDFVHSFPLERYGTRPEDLARWEQTRRDHPPVNHPVIRTHPETGQKALFVNDGFTTRINELSQEESDALLPLLFQHFAKPEFTLRWRWQAGDVAFWDNRVTQHYATDDYRPAHRIMHRATIQGDVPF